MAKLFNSAYSFSPVPIYFYCKSQAQHCFSLSICGRVKAWEAYGKGGNTSPLQSFPRLPCLVNVASPPVRRDSTRSLQRFTYFRCLFLAYCLFLLFIGFWSGLLLFLLLLLFICHRVMPYLSIRDESNHQTKNISLCQAGRGGFFVCSHLYCSRFLPVEIGAFQV